MVIAICVIVRSIFNLYHSKVKVNFDTNKIKTAIARHLHRLLSRPKSKGEGGKRLYLSVLYREKEPPENITQQ